MRRKLVLVMSLTIVLIGMLGVALKVERIEASGTITIKADGSIDPPDAPINTTDMVTYYFTDNINDSIVVERDNIVVDGAGYSVQGTGIGIDLPNRSNVTIKNTNIEGFYGGYGGIRLYQSSNITIVGNNITGNSWYGICLYESSNNILRKNSMTDNEANFGVDGYTLSHFINDVDASNTVDGKTIYYWINKQDTVVPLDAGYVALVNCTRIMVQNLNLTKNWEGLLLAATTNSTISRNNITKNRGSFTRGILLWNSSDNDISRNNITANGENGVVLYQSSNNRIVWNNITDNGRYGIYFYESSNNTISGNDITDNHRYADSKGVLIEKSSNNVIDGNILINNNYGGIELAGSDNNVISANEVRNNAGAHYGIELTYSDNNTIVGNNVTGNKSGIRLGASYYTTVVENNVINNTAIGVKFETASYSTFRNNTIAGSEHNFGVFTFYTGVHLSTYTQDIDTSNTVNGKPIYYLIDQEGLTIDSSDTGYLGLVNCTNIHIKDVTLSNNGQGLLLAFTTNSTIENATITDNRVGIHVLSSDENTITANNITDNDSGISIWRASFNNFTENTLTNNGISIGSLIMGWGTLYTTTSIPSEDNIISSNTMSNGGIGLTNSGTTRTIITNNTIKDADIGISLDWGACGNKIYHNNFIDNKKHVHIDTEYGAVVNVWDNGYPSGGNYWSNYTGVDSDHDGIGDTAHIIDGNNQDNHPLMGLFSNFSVTHQQETHHVTTICNSTISEFQFNDVAKTISFNVTGPDYTLGFCRVTIPNIIVQDLWQENYTVLVDGKNPLTMNNWTDGTYTYIYFTYQHSEHKVTIIPEFSSWTSMLLILIVLTVAIAIYKRRLLKRPIH